MIADIELVEQRCEGALAVKLSRPRVEKVRPRWGWRVLIFGIF